jgi:isoleucyl-tRNA synthetase
VDRPSAHSGRSLRKLALEAAESRINFVPDWGRNRLRGMLESRPDWCISRQRAWGLPIPAFYDQNDQVLLTTASVAAIAKAFREEGSDAWFTKDPAHLLRFYDPASDPDLDDSRKSLDLASLRKGYDIFDVWFESGTSWNAVMRERFGDAAFPVSLYLEGSDQHRGWFQTSLLPALGMMGTSPYESVLTHGFMVDKHGHKMSKSIGNTLDVDQLLEDFGADVCRWWLSSISYEADIKADTSFFQTAGESYRKIRNTLRFMLSNLDDFQVSKDGTDGQCVAMSDIPPTSLEAWVLSELNQLIDAVTASFNAYEFQRANTLLYNFCNDTLSAVYLMATKDRLYCDVADSARRRRAQTVLWDITDALCRLLAPILVHTADEAFNTLNKTDTKDPANSVHAARFPSTFNVTLHESWQHLMKLRDRALKAIETARAKGIPGSEDKGELDNPLDCGVILPDPDDKLKDFDPEDLADLLGISRVEVTQSGELEVIDLLDQPVCERSRKRHATVKQRSDGGLLCDRDAQAVGLD